MEFRILGPVEALADGHRVRCTGRPLQLLALLLIHRGRGVPADAAIEALWGDALPDHPGNALQTVVSRLRRTLGEDAVQFRADGYRLADGELDAERFGRLARAGQDALARGEPAVGDARLAEALALWRGAALEDVRFEPFAVAVAERLEEERLEAVGARIDARLALGRHRELVPELHALVAEHPLRESLRGQLMLALYRCGRQSDALAAYNELRAALRDQLGLDPSPELRALERSILRHEAGMPAPRPARRDVVCVRVDVRATSAGAPLDPELLRDVIGRCHTAAEEVARRHGHPPLELLADGVAVVFGAPVAHEDDAARASDVARELLDALAGLARELEPDDVDLAVRAGVAAGPALTRPGSPPVGDVVATAGRLARAAAAGEVGVDERTRALLDAGRGADAPLIGRAAELARLTAAFDDVAATRAPRLLAVVGEPGIGKSRLARELARALGTRATVLTGRCPAYGEEITFSPVREMVLAAGPLDALTAGLEDGALVAAAVAGALGLRDGAPGEATPWAFRHLFAAVASERPLVLVFEDLHWADPALLDLVEQLAAGLRAPVLLLGLARPELLDARPGWPAVRPAALSDVESRRLLAARELPADRQAAVAARAGGNPLFLEQLAAHVTERGAPGALPPALHALLAARLDLLDPADRALLEAAAVEGAQFHLGGVQAVAANAAAGRRLDALVDRELLLPADPVVAGERAWRFRHALVHDAAYAALPLRARAEGHERIAGWLASVAPEADARIGAHLERAHAASAALRGERAPALAGRAAARLAAAAVDAHRRGDLPGEIGLLSRATALLAGDDRARAELLPALAGALFEAGTLARGEAVAEEALALAGRLGLPLVRARAAVERERLRVFLNPETVDPEASLAVCRDAIGPLERMGDELGLARAHYLTCELVWLQGRSESGYRSAERVVRHARRAGSGFEIDTGVSYMAWAIVVNEIPVSEGIRRCDRLERMVAGRFAALSVRGFRAVLGAMAGRTAEARREVAAARAGLQDLGLRQASVWMAVHDALAESLAGDAAAAERALEDAERLADAIGDRWFLSTILVDRAHAVLAQGDVARAAAAVARIETVPAPNDTEWRIKRAAARGRLAALEGDEAVALAEAEAATTIADGTEMLTFRADAYRDLAGVAVRFGRRPDAERAARTALALYAAKENVAGAAQVMQAAPSPPDGA